MKITKLQLKKIIREQIANLKESTDMFDYNEISIEQLQDAVNADAKAWMRTTKIMENPKTYGIVNNTKKKVEYEIRKLDQQLRRLR